MIGGNQYPWSTTFEPQHTAQKLAFGDQEKNTLYLIRNLVPIIQSQRNLAQQCAYLASAVARTRLVSLLSHSSSTLPGLPEML